MTVHTRVVEKTCRSMSFALMVAFLSFGAISGCSNSNDDNDWFGAGDSDGSDGGLGVVDPDAGIYPNIQVIQPFLSGAIDPIKVQYWDQTYYWGPDSDGNDACFKGTVGIEDSSNLAQETAPGPECPTSLGQVTPCNPAAAADTVASGAVQSAISGCEHDGAACTDILVPDITDEVTCESTVRQADPIAAGAAWFQNIDAPGTKGGTAAHWWYGTRADKTFDAEDGYGGTQIDYISDATNINIAASGGGSGPTTRVNNIYLCSNKDVVNPAESPDVCTLSSLFGSCGYAANGDPEACKINNIGLVDGAYNVFIRSATPSEGFGDSAPLAAVRAVTISTVLGDRTTAEVADQPDSKGKGVATMPFACGKNSGTCGVPSIYHAVTSPANSQYTDTGVYPLITFTVLSSGSGTTAGEFQIQFPPDLGGVSCGNACPTVEMLGDRYSPDGYCTSGQVLTAVPQSGAAGNLWFCVGQGLNIASPGSDTLVWIYPPWSARGLLLSTIGKKAQTTYNPQLKARGFQPVVGFALPVVSWKAARTDTPYCPYTDLTDANNKNKIIYNYQTQMGSLTVKTKTSTLVGIVQVAKGEDWTSQSPQDLVDCLKLFSGDLQGIAIDDEYTVLSDAQSAAIMDWCNGQFASKRCGFVVGHNSTVISYPGAMQNTCMAYTHSSKLICDGSQARNIYNEMIPKPPLFDLALPFDILN
jgi:hypothetical protein